MESQRSLSSVRPISLTPPGMPTNLVFDNIIEDIIVGTRDGFEVVDCEAQKAVVFLQMVGFVADYPASSEVLDVMNHNSRAPCTHCTFRYRTDHTQEHDNTIHKCYSNSTAVNFSRPSYRRGLFSTLSLRSSFPAEKQYVYMGMHGGSIEDISQPGKWPLLKLSAELDKIGNCPSRDSRGNKVVPGKLDPYCSNVVAPDHCITSLVSGLVELFFKEIRNTNSDVTVTLRFELLLCRSLRDVGVPGHSSIYNERNGVNSLSMSTLYALSSILPSVLRSLQLENLSCFCLIAIMSKLVNLTFLSPTFPDSDQNYELVHGKGIKSYHIRLQELPREYVNLVYKYGRSHPQYRQIIDRPNTHRLL